jgi:hypothetical protein
MIDVGKQSMPKYKVGDHLLVKLSGGRAGGHCAVSDCWEGREWGGVCRWRSTHDAITRESISQPEGWLPVGQYLGQRTQGSSGLGGNVTARGSMRSTGRYCQRSIIEPKSNSIFLAPSARGPR